MQGTQVENTNDIYIDPIIVNAPEEEKLVHKQNNIISCFLIIFAIVICSLIIAAGYFVYKNYIGQKAGLEPTDNVLITPTSQAIQISDYSTVKFNLDYIQRVMPVGVTPYKRPQIDLLNKIISLAVQKQWTGSLTDNIGFSYIDFKSEFDTYYNDYQAYIKAKELPSDMISSLLGDSSELIKSYISVSKNEFLTIITSLGFDQSYIDEINSYVLPENENLITYLSDNFDNSSYIGSSTVPINGDYGRREIYIDPRDINYIYQDLKKTIFGQRLDENALIAASTKMVVYHEMAHVLMQAYINKHVPAEIKLNGNEDMWKFSNIDFLEPSKAYFWAWSFNKEISDERIAQGLMLKALFVKYGLSEDEINDVYDVLVNKDNYNMNTINTLGDVFHDQYGHLLRVDWTNFDSYLYDQITREGRYLKPSDDHTILRKMFDVTNMLPGYIGYFNPAEEKDWGFFKKG